MDAITLEFATSRDRNRGQSARFSAGGARMWTRSWTTTGAYLGRGLTAAYGSASQIMRHSRAPSPSRKRRRQPALVYLARFWAKATPKAIWRLSAATDERYRGQGKVPITAIGGSGRSDEKSKRGVEVHRLYPEGDNGMFLEYRRFLIRTLAASFGTNEQSTN
jgi:hypothetical protein